mmetsp:Transcript_35390/g.65023  ORF Transcript_35390/g.65023 Transcript_35390/m.65023 type:complete len:90 (+) Transcript_35390:160-429(+)|eukprot:CAMPEP_0197449486 /NCGR_PEP_ID=MMETSP1175-20131217/21716_1 /TAXON_ID=1003142 /ORGANISM="Triceratium dubium, Strain CCMP147" /LENGTH=89 /DNA_ID=CAMNT_0042981631 /DNA_START=160 /DNA_END=429 /DNA_ORIENTATION=-
MEKVLYSIAWFLFLIFIAWPVAIFCGAIWMLLIPFESLAKSVKECTQVLERMMTWPREVGRAMVRGEAQFPAPGSGDGWGAGGFRGGTC